MKQLSKTLTDTLTLRMVDGYGIATNYSCRNRCPYDGSRIIKTGINSGCYDGEFTHTDRFTCEQNCTIQYPDILKFNGYER